MTNAALLYSHDLSAYRWGDFELVDFRPSIEAHLSTGKVKGEQSVSARAGLGSQYLFDSPFSLYFETNLLYETDQKFKDQRIGPELNVVPVLPVIGMGRTIGLIPDGEESAVTWRWRPSIGAALGVPIRQSDPTADDSAIERIYAKLRIDVGLDFVASGIGLDETTLFTEIEGYRVFAKHDPSKGNHGFIQTGLNLGFTENVSLEFGLKKGDTAPNLTHRVDQIYAALGIKF
jgi:hypothetical protein